MFVLDNRFFHLQTIYLCNWCVFKIFYGILVQVIDISSWIFVDMSNQHFPYDLTVVHG